MPKLHAVVLALVLAALPLPALAEAAGTARGVDPAATAATSAETRTLRVGADIFIGDRVDTGAKGQVQILFADKTELVVGPSSSLVIEDYLLRNDGSAGNLAVNMLSGAFRFVTGDSAKSRYKIETPSGTIGVRGTALDVFVENGLAWALLYHGAIVSCALGEVDCKVSESYCEVTQIGTREVDILGDVRETEGDERKAFKGRFIYSDDESPLLRQFRVAQAYDCLHRKPDGATPQFNPAVKPSDDPPPPQIGRGG